jgi:CRP/FNR family transcriptional regulator, cyclic AMP receptor protein
MDESHLTQVPLFASLPRPQLQRLSQLADEVDVGPGKQLVHEGAFAYEFFAIEDGTAEVTREGRHIADLGPGDFFGEMGAVSKHARSATVTATSPLTAIVMSAGDFRRMSAELPDVAQAIEAAIEERTQTLM